MRCQMEYRPIIKRSWSLSGILFDLLESLNQMTKLQLPLDGLDQDFPSSSASSSR